VACGDGYISGDEKAFPKLLKFIASCTLIIIIMATALTAAWQFPS